MLPPSCLPALCLGASPQFFPVSHSAHHTDACQVFFFDSGFLWFVIFPSLQGSSPLEGKLSRPSFPSWKSFLASRPILAPLPAFSFHLSCPELPLTLHSPTHPGLTPLVLKLSLVTSPSSAGRRNNPPSCPWQGFMSTLCMFLLLLLPRYFLDDKPPEDRGLLQGSVRVSSCVFLLAP